MEKHLWVVDWSQIWGSDLPVRILACSNRLRMASHDPKKLLKSSLCFLGNWSWQIALDGRHFLFCPSVQLHVALFTSRLFLFVWKWGRNLWHSLIVSTGWIGDVLSRGGHLFLARWGVRFVLIDPGSVRLVTVKIVSFDVKSFFFDLQVLHWKETREKSSFKNHG